MLTIIKNWMLLKYLSKRYKFKRKYTLYWGSSRFAYNCMEGFSITVCLWDKMFNETLLHEIGHLVHFKKSRGYNYFIKYPNNMKETYLFCDGRPLITDKLTVQRTTYAKCVDMEGKASRFAMKALKSTSKIKKDSYPHLAKCLQSYLQYSCKKEIADVSYMMLKYIKG